MFLPQAIENSKKPELTTSAAHSASISHHLHAQVDPPINHHSVMSFQTSAAHGVTAFTRFYPEHRVTREAAGQTNAFLHVRITLREPVLKMESGKVRVRIVHIASCMLLRTPGIVNGPLIIVRFPKTKQQLHTP